MTIILSIETSCDETSIAVTKNGKEVLSNVVFSQIDYHKNFGGVVPEIAARKHLEFFTIILKKAIKKANINKEEIDLVAVTEGPGLISSLLVGINGANVFAYINDKPIIGINHLIGHIYSAQIENELKFPNLVLLISGGHTELFYIQDHFKIKHIGYTLDDAIGEVYDKISKSLNLGYPGGPIIEKKAKKGHDVFNFVRPYLKNKNLNFSFSGLKSKIIDFINKKNNLDDCLNDICCSFQASVVDVLLEKTKRAIQKFPVLQLVIVGGVAANKFLKKKFQKQFPSIELIIPKKEYCTDQAAMIGIAAYYQNKFYKKAQKKYNLNGNANMNLK
ncbi:MAG: tRNA (adenosine(37)-N6)-threonylcarbamoyltransferase complex transferase subunit [Candidatus Phytoplasma cynodontis]|uniref:tRNA (adenosine(37)-N6)-threonylcarbamoyltransferase complex transferase subunit TsaD n=1 Tax='Cynodon dactylon' phytoplasma TaxID=295320 RepID=UPI001265CC73|nr:tRNA (adenosine(37)-N6)-threonylcarbamoyltransferase complex transferase subunit TsaD ['Cynodon dactylon' phytoplasma]KAB8121872.1 tRNA (adenosine(37)-N6)-threonylcarbamoyltransferase complex transferase subunit TsaD ['Cynodon dactylon' phytoplasma]WIA07803.1 MAG: tRNA (adenosine(37)-N6)-threonylcarbamoyltransferase complex transferase subunit [Candidatus Phytoplasma cynodontis]